MSIRAIYEKGVFKPLEDVPIKEGTEVDVYPRTEKAKSTKRRKPFSATEAFGIWADREDISDSVEYVNRIRQPRWRQTE